MKQTTQRTRPQSVLPAGLSRQGPEDEEEPLVQKEGCSERGKSRREGAAQAPAQVPGNQTGRQGGNQPEVTQSPRTFCRGRTSLSTGLVSGSFSERLNCLATAPRAQGGGEEVSVDGSVTTLSETRGRLLGRLTRPPLASPMGERFFLFR